MHVRRRRLAASLALLAFALASSVAPAKAAPALHVIPFPGTPDASPSSHIIFSSLTASALGSVTVSGSSSGTHAGHLVALPDAAGTAFVPDYAFVPGEQVQVTANLTSSAAGTASGDPGATVLSFSFTVAVPVSFGSAVQPPGTSASPTQSFRSAPGLHPPVVSATSDPDTRSGDIFLTPQLGPQSGPMILDARGKLVWFRPVPGFASNLEVQRYHGQRVLTFFQQTGGNMHTNEDLILNRSYQAIATVRGGYGDVPDLHEFQITPRGSALIVADTPVRADLSSVSGPSDGVVTDDVIQELDIKTGQVLWEWHSLGHIPLNASFIGKPKPQATYDYVHMNSIQELPNGNLLLSGRHTWGVYLIDKQTGKIVWTVGGKYSNFSVRQGAGFEWQHDAHLLGDTLTLFDDAASPWFDQERQSSAKVIRLNTASMTATLVRRYTHRPSLLSLGEGGAQILPNHDAFVGWGNQPDFSEYGPGGRQIFNGSFPLGVTSYRAYRFAWHGQPTTRPSVAISNQSGGEVKVYVSWNGATNVAAWRAEGGSSPRALHSLGQSRRTGFETTLTLHSPGRYLVVQALNAGGKVLAASQVHRT